VPSTAVSRPVLHHVTMKTTRLDEMLEWYATTVGMKPNFRDEVAAWTTNDAANHRVAFLAVPGLRDDAEKVIHTGVHHLAFEYADLDELLTCYIRLRDQGIEPHACLDHGLTLSLYYLDPDGNSVELQADNFGDWAASTAFMKTSPEFRANAIGTNVDVAELVRAWEGGAGAADLHRRAYAGEFDPGTPLDLRLP
jgi:catechol 2,3-dioxygenase